MSQHSEYVSQIERILSKLKQARSRQLKCYGSDGHGFRLKEPISEEEIQAFEAREQIRLPEDYRLFLTHAGNGGAGPYNGIYPLEDWADFADMEFDDCPDHFLALHCPLVPGMPSTEDWAKEFGEISPYLGTLSVGDQGCANFMQLIVTGPCRGRVVYANSGGPPYMVHEPDFLSWYERWLDELLQGYNFGWFGYGPGGGEDDFFRILRDPQADDDFKEEAAFAFCRLPELSDHAAPQIAEYLDDPLPGVRAGALAAIAYFHLSDFFPQVMQRLEDPSAQVRKQAVNTAMKLDSRLAAEAVARRLHEDQDEDVFRAAFYKLKDAEALSKAELLRLLDDPTRCSLRGQVIDIIQWSAEDEPLLILLLANSDVSVRSRALSGLKQIQGRGSLPHLLELLPREQTAGLIERILQAIGEFKEPSTVPVLLEWVQSADDFHRLEAMAALAKIGDERAVKPAQSMLQEQRQPVRRDAQGFMSQTHSQIISQLVQQSLAESPNPTLRGLVKQSFRIVKS